MTIICKNRFFQQSLIESDPDVFSLIGQESCRQNDEIQLIASENIVSRAVLEAQGSILTNKYAEGYPSKRYYGGCQYVDDIENIAIERAKKLFNVNFVNVQSHSGSQMNQGVFLALMHPGDSFMGLSLDSGGHLTHGSSVNMSGKWFKAIPYNVRKEDGLLDMHEIESLAIEYNPKLIIVGGTAYSRVWDWERFRSIADSIGAYLMADISHISGLVVGGQHPSPVPHCHIVTTTTHKSLRGPRGGLIMTNHADLAKKINSAIFPGLQGGPFMHSIAAKAVAFGEALSSEFRDYAKQIVLNSQALAKKLQFLGFDIVSGGTDNHLMLVDLRSKRMTGKRAESILGRVSITCNKNSIPFDPESPFITSGIRLGTPSGTTRGFKEKDFEYIGELIAQILDGSSSDEENHSLELTVLHKVQEFVHCFPIYDFSASALK
ncbi:serine hydroxymethyltransferase [Candidatus Liberibacter asiaticus]|uniref:Serine hydroxymethyltransferase n=3 Tax=Liberibacter asiaticus TaxID=34021 RepID=C6XHS9_LIBAP|nr:serine hydroxymethyltransferase [Candidatus Liberibacter asiaticus]ACT56822.1 serine hydroxymethyltransferase [Candidatus Liberibacter asiaticus str. psy62]AGH16589.1 serine hydroxymethyltransferase [Candidatus Liberibacter asiaticus str. gxpsy]ALK06979.1 serine hydroxymethyltransferase [Candidatus Liberibacter asiaticus]ASK52449.1 serine hydroxymethyltransferase [Candidatus Liberibacter asiaticus]AWL13776.1 serine hydroxymethyltransferase [Candidatus Liberibacter asiaticus]